MGRGVASGERRYARAIRLTHEAALSPERFPTALEAIAEYAGGSGTMFVCHDFGQSEHWQYVGGLREDLSRVYLAHYSDNIFAREVMRRGPGLYAAHELADVSAIMRTGMGADIWVPQKIRTILQMGHPTITSGLSSGGFAVALSDQHIDDLARATRRWQRIAPQLRLAADLYLAKSDRRRRVRDNASLLELLGDPALLLAPDGLLLACNALAETLLGMGRVLRISARGAVSVADPVDDRRLRAALLVVRQEGIASVLRLFSPEEWLLILAPIVEPAGDGRITGAGPILLRLINPRADQSRRARTASRLYELSTAEAKVLAVIALGRSTPEVARMLRLSPETVRTHLKHIFDKTGLRSQAELAQLVARLPVMG